MSDQVFTALQEQQAADLGVRQCGRMKPSDAEYQIAGLPAVESPATETYHDPDDTDCCPNCGGDGVVYMCLDEIGCVDPESGCDLCERRCDWCRPTKPKGEPA